MAYWCLRWPEDNRQYPHAWSMTTNENGPQFAVPISHLNTPPPLVHQPDIYQQLRSKHQVPSGQPGNPMSLLRNKSEIYRLMTYWTVRNVVWLTRERGGQSHK